MDEKKLEEMEKLYMKSVLGKDVKETKKIRKKNNNNGIFIIFFITALMIIGIMVKIFSNKDVVIKEENTETVLASENSDFGLVKEEDNVENFEDISVQNIENNPEIKKEELLQSETILSNDKVKTETKSKNNINQSNIQTVKKENKIRYMIQLTASKNYSEVEKEMIRIKKMGTNVKIIDEGGKFRYKLVLLNEFTEREAAEKYMENLKKQNLIPNDSWVKTIEKK